MTIQTNRRALLGSMMLAPVAAAATATAFPVPAGHLPYAAGWRRANAVLAEAKAACERYAREVHDPMRVKLGRFPSNMFDVAAKDGTTARFNWSPSNPDAYDNHVGTQIREGAARCKREWAAFEARRKALNTKQINAEMDRLCFAEDDADNALLMTPAPDAAALLWKLERLWGEEEQDGEFSFAWNMSILRAVMADARRLLGEGGRA